METAALARPARLPARHHLRLSDVVCPSVNPLPWATAAISTRSGFGPSVRPEAALPSRASAPPGSWRDAAQRHSA